MTLFQLECRQQLVDNHCILPKLITDKVFGNFQTWLLTILDSFLTVQIGGKEYFIIECRTPNVRVMVFETFFHGGNLQDK